MVAAMVVAAAEVATVAQREGEQASNNPRFVVAITVTVPIKNTELLRQLGDPQHYVAMDAQ